MASYTILGHALNASVLGCWEAFVGRFTSVVGYTNFGDVFVQDPKTGQLAVMYVFDPELAETRFSDLSQFERELLTHKEIQPHLLRPELSHRLEQELRPLKEEEVFIPEPYPFLGGGQDPVNFGIGNVWVFVDLVGQLQGVCESA